jgi:hypothetical protein
VFVGGLARALSWRRTGRPHPAFVAAIALELIAVPALAVWQHQVVTMYRADGAPAPSVGPKGS